MAQLFMKRVKFFTGSLNALAAASTFSLVEHFLWKLVTSFELSTKERNEVTCLTCISACKSRGWKVEFRKLSS